MANFLKSFLNSLHLNDEDEDDDDEYEEYVAQTSAREQRRTERAERLERKAEQQTNTRASRSYSEEDTEEESRQNTTNLNDLRKERAAKAEKPAKVVPLRGNTVTGMGIRVMKPTSFEDSQDICDVLLAGKATIINLEGFDVELAQRVMDFISGAVYAANGKLHQISNYIFIISPENVDISGDYLDMIKQNGFEVPTINRNF
ncbi:MAG: cell division protein SepF [Lachnospiraceae bacterium]|nr:cell division protein SepF [Lachnospiraceae bacterium]